MNKASLTIIATVTGFLLYQNLFPVSQKPVEPNSVLAERLLQDKGDIGALAACGYSTLDQQTFVGEKGEVWEWETGVTGILIPKNEIRYPLYPVDFFLSTHCPAEVLDAYR